MAGREEVIRDPVPLWVPSAVCQNWFFDKISTRNVSFSLHIIAFDGKCQELLFGMHIMGVHATWLGRSGLRVILLCHGLRLSIFQVAITQQPVGVARSSGCRWTALLVGQPGLGYQGIALQLLGFLCAFSRSCWNQVPGSPGLSRWSRG